MPCLPAGRQGRGASLDLLRRLFEDDEYAKLSLDEEDLPYSWDFWNRPPPSLRNFPLQEDRTILQLVLLLCVVVLHPDR